MNTAPEAAPRGLVIRRYVEQFASASAEARRVAGEVVHEIDLGGSRARLRFAGDELVPAVMPALSHLEVQPSGAPVEITVELFDGRSTGVTPPPFPLRGAVAPGGGEVRHFGGEDVVGHFHSGIAPHDGRFAALTLYDERQAIARYFVDARERIQWYEHAAPLRSVLHWGLNRRDRLLVHAGAVGRDGRCVLLTGGSGSGKSTTAVAAALSGYDFLGDDYVLVDLAGSTPLAHSLYASAKLAPTATALLPALPARCHGPLPAGATKHVIDPMSVCRRKLRRHAEIVAIVLPRRSHSGTALRPSSAHEALMALAPATVLQAPRNDGAGLRPLAELARRLPTYTLDLDGDPVDGVVEIGRLLGRVQP